MSKPIGLFQANRPDSLSKVRVLLDKARHESVQYFPSPFDWRDEVLYFLLPDRFSDGKEGPRSLLSRAEIQSLRKTDSPSDMNWLTWRESGNRWQGGTIKGV